EYDLALKERQTEYDTALINLKKKKREYERALSLFKSRIVSNQVLEQNRDELNQAETLLKQAGKNLEDSKRLSSRRERTNLNIYSMETERNRLLLATKKARTDVRYWKTQIEKLKVIAPHNGVVINKKAENGVLLNAGMEIVTIADVANLRISAEIDEVDAGRITEKMQGVVRFDAFPGERFKAEVTDVSPRAEIKSGRTVVETKLRLLQPTEKLKINNQVEAEILLQTKENVPLVPLESLVSEKKGYSIWTVNDLDALTKKRIETGISDLSKIEITGGLKEGDRVALPGGKPFSENEKIQPVLKKSE
ncbi:MAG: efflux RND transporter periplasmic adaptor subunit, partial [Nitrospinota bacterium]